MSLTRLWLLSAASVALLAGCGQVVVFGHVVGEDKAPEVAESTAPPANRALTSSDAPASATAAAAATVSVLKSVTLNVASGATDNVASDTPLAPDLLLEAIRNELRSRKLLDENNPQVTGTAEVQITGASVGPSTNAVVFGYKMMAGTLIGDVHFSGGTSDLHVLAETKLTIAVDSEKKKDPLGPLYRRFAVLTADRLQGVESKPDPNAAGGQPRY